MKTAAVHTCPHCGAAVEAYSKQSSFATCRHCGGLMAFTGAEGPQKLTLPKARPGTSLLVQMGSTGQWLGQHWEAIGRACCHTDDGWENWWTLLMDDGNQRLLYEKRGNLLMLQPLEGMDKEIRELLGRIKLNKRAMKAGDHEYWLQQHVTGKRMELEGEGVLPDNDGSFETYCLQATDGRYLMAVQTGQQKQIHLWLAGAVQPDALSLEPTAIKGHEDATLHCLKCTKPIVLKARYLSGSCTCGHCGQHFRLVNEGLATPKNGETLNKAALPLHATGNIDGVAYTVCGMAKKADADGYMWREYTLFGATGYAWLSEYDGHWIFLREHLVAPALDPYQESFKEDGLLFERFNKYNFISHGTVGEFADVFFEKKQTKVREYINPPYIWVQETSGHGHTWLKGRHIGKAELKAAFADITLPTRRGVGAVQPGLLPTKGKTFYIIMAAAVVVFLFVHTLMASFNQQKVVLDAEYRLPDTAVASLPAIVTEPFRLEKKSSNLQFEIYAPVTNDWFELGLELTDLGTGKEYGVEKGVEFYMGYEDGESWSEGARSAEAWLSSLPQGRYTLELQPARGSTNVKEFRVKVTNDVPADRNLVSMVVILVLITGLYWLYNRLHEKARWQNSPFGDSG
jgi:ribosomal protein L37AE/L43A